LHPIVRRAFLIGNRRIAEEKKLITTKIKKAGASSVVPRLSDPVPVNAPS
jgi:hypothetical protein